jgi:hypothetical protein
MSRFREYDVTPQAIAQAKALGLWGFTTKRVQRMARRSTPVTTDWGNRRFYDYVLNIQGDKVLSVTRIDFEAA